MTKRLVAAMVACALLAGCATTDSTAKKVLIGIAAVAAVAAAVAVAKRGGGGGGYSTPVQDYDWDWDLFYGNDGQLVWACRGVQSAQFADLERCTYKLKVDQRWPALQAP